MKNVILVTVDTLRKDMVGFYRKEKTITPFIDSLKDNCIFFKDAYATGPYTQSSFQGILASSYYLEYGKEKNLSRNKTLVSEPLKQGGIYTAGFHSNAYLSYYFGYNKGWETFYDSMQDDVTDMYPFIRGDVINKKVESFLKGYNFSKSLFLWVHYIDVHEPYIAEEKYISDIDISLKLSKDEMFEMFSKIILPRDMSDQSKIDILRKLYMAKVAETDDYIKNLFEIFNSFNLLDNSTIILTSDHGDEFGEHGGLSHDGKMYNELLSVPLVIYDKTFLNSAIEAPVSLVDISPTICSMFDIEPPASFKGKSLYPLGSGLPETLYGEAIGKIGHKEKDTDLPVYCMIENNQKTIFKKENNIWEAYDQSSDAKEENNLDLKIDKNVKDKLNKFVNRNN